MGFENGTILRVTLGARAPGGDTVVNTFHYNIEATDWLDNDTDPQLLADAFRDDVRPSWATLFRPTYAILPVHVVEEKDPQAPTAARRSWESGAEIAGTSADVGELLPSFITALVSLRTANIGRRFRGRTFLAVQASESMQSGGLWSSSMMTAFAAIMGTIPQQPDLVSGYSWSTAKWCVYSRTQRAANLDPYAPEVTGFTIRQQLHSLRSRASY